MLTHEKPLYGYHQEIGGSAGSGSHGGESITRPKNMPRKSDCDHVVSSGDGLASAIQNDGVSIYLDESAGRISMADHEDIPVGSGVTVVGQYCDPDHKGRGTVIHQPHYPRYTFKIGYGNEPPTLWGISFQGPMLAGDWRERNDYPDEENIYFDPRDDSRTEGDLEASDWYAGGLFCHTSQSAGTFRAVGCEFLGWSVAGLELGSKERETQAEIHRCSFHNNLMETLGYGAELYNGHTDFSYCFFDRNRHAVSASGRPTVSYTVEDSLSGDGDVAGHVLDMHDMGSNVSNADDPNVGGEYFTVKRSTFMTTRDLAGYDQEAVAQRGESEQGRAFHDSDQDADVPGDEITQCHFWQTEKPKARGEQGDAYREDDPGNTWQSLNPHDNLFGPNKPEGRLKRYGAPRLDQKPDKPDKPDMSQQTLKIEGLGGPDVNADYAIVIYGDVETTDENEPSEQINEQDGGRVVIEGNMWGGVDEFLVSGDAQFESGEFELPCVVTLDGKNITGALVGPSAVSQPTDDDLREWVNSKLSSLRIVAAED